MGWGERGGGERREGGMSLFTALDIWKSGLPSRFIVRPYACLAPHYFVLDQR